MYEDTPGPQAALALQAGDGLLPGATHPHRQHSEWSVPGLVLPLRTGH